MESLSFDNDLRVLRFPLELLLEFTLPGEPEEDSSEAILIVTSLLFPPSSVDRAILLFSFDDCSFVSTDRILSNLVSLVSLTMKSSHA